MRSVLQSTPADCAPTAVICRADTFVVRQGVGEAQQSILILTSAEAVELIEIIADNLPEDADQLRATADKLHDAADRIESTVFDEIAKDITTT